jgi:hypothetical protein
MEQPAAHGRPQSFTQTIGRFPIDSRRPALYRRANWHALYFVAVTSRLQFTNFPSVHNDPREYAGFHDPPKSRRPARPRTPVHSGEFQRSAIDCEDAAISSLPRLGSRVRIPSPAPVIEKTKRRGEPRLFAYWEIRLGRFKRRHRGVKVTAGLYGRDSCHVRLIT